MKEQSIKPYDITNGEKISYGYYSAMDVVFQKFMNKLEIFMYDEFNLTFSFDFKISSGKRFNHYLEELAQPSPIFVFSLNPLMRDSLFHTDNRFINLILAKEKLFKEGKVGLHNGFSLENNNSKEVKKVVGKIVKLFESCWSKVHQVECRLKSVVSNRIKAKVMDSTESCVNVSLQMKQNDFVSNWDFCFSTYQLDRIMEKRGAKGLLAASGLQNHDERIKQYFTNLVLEQSKYELKGILGSINLTSKDLLESYQKKSIIPIQSVVKNHAQIQLNNIPVLAADIGETDGQISLKIEDSYNNAATEVKKSKKSFSKLTFGKK